MYRRRARQGGAGRRAGRRVAASESEAVDPWRGARGRQSAAIPRWVRIFSCVRVLCGNPVSLQCTRVHSRLRRPPVRSRWSGLVCTGLRVRRRLIIPRSPVRFRAPPLLLGRSVSWPGVTYRVTCEIAGRSVEVRTRCRDHFVSEAIGLRLLPRRSLLFREGPVARECRRLRRSTRRAPLRCVPTTARPVVGAISVRPVVARGVMRTRAVPLPSMPSARAAPRDTSSARPPTKGPRSLILTTTDRPLARFVTRTRVPSGSEG